MKQVITRSTAFFRLTARFAVLAPASLVLAACVSTSGSKVEADLYSQLKEGKTTKSEIIATLGQPKSSTFVGEQESLTYQFTHRESKAMIPVVGAFMPSKQESQLCKFMVDAKGVLVNKMCSSADFSQPGLLGR